MIFHETKEFAAGVIREEFAAAGIVIKQIILFGSQSRGDAVPDSDWDFLVCVKEEMPFSQKAVVTTKIQRKLAQRLISADVIIKSEAKVMQERDNVGVITYYAMKDGVIL